jgi:hypothetical protein
MVLTMAALQTDFDQLGFDRLCNELVSCTDGCFGISNDRDMGILPRCLNLEHAQAEGRGCLAVGLNPGESDKCERDYYIQQGISYCSVKSYWNQKLHEIDYHSKVRKLIRCVGLNGPIIWTELAKCERSKESRQVPLDTLRHCARRFLLRELKLVPPNWPIIGIGKEAFVALSYIAPERAVIGVPHPTGAWGRSFDKKLFPCGLMNEERRARAVDAISSAELKAVWLGW